MQYTKCLLFLISLGFFLGRFLVPTRTGVTPAMSYEALAHIYVGGLLFSSVTLFCVVRYLKSIFVVNNLEYLGAGVLTKLGLWMWYLFALSLVLTGVEGVMFFTKVLGLR